MYDKGRGIQNDNFDIKLTVFKKVTEPAVAVLGPKESSG